jgi:hypothetical protein
MATRINNDIFGKSQYLTNVVGDFRDHTLHITMRKQCAFMRYTVKTVGSHLNVKINLRSLVNQFEKFIKLDRDFNAVRVLRRLITVLLKCNQTIYETRFNLLVI